MFGIFVICWLLFFVLIVLVVILNDVLNLLCYFGCIVYWIGYFNCVINLFLYCLCFLVFKDVICWCLLFSGEVINKILNSC